MRRLLEEPTDGSSPKKDVTTANNKPTKLPSYSASSSPSTSRPDVTFGIASEPIAITEPDKPLVLSQL